MMNLIRRKGSTGLILVLFVLCFIMLATLLLIGGVTIFNLWTIEGTTGEGLYKLIPLLIFSLLSGLAIGIRLWKKLVLFFFGEKALKDFLKKTGGY